MAEKKSPQTKYAWISINNRFNIYWPTRTSTVFQVLVIAITLSKERRSTDELRQSGTTQRPHRLHRLLMLLSQCGTQTMVASDLLNKVLGWLTTRASQALTLIASDVSHHGYEDTHTHTHARTRAHNTHTHTHTHAHTFAHALSLLSPFRPQ